MNADRRTQPERSAATQQALVDAGRRLFGELGYGAVSTIAIADAAGVSRGAMYHQFADKRDLFEAVFEDLERELVQTIGSAVSASGATDPIEALIVGCLAWLDASADPHVQRIAILDAPAVLGWARWREIELRHTIGLVEGALSDAVKAGRIRAQPIRPLALVIVGALDDASQYRANAKDSPQAASEVRSVVEQLVSGLTLDTNR